MPEEIAEDEETCGCKDRCHRTDTECEIEGCTCCGEMVYLHGKERYQL